jgi:two-component system response regulator VanR
LIIEDGPYIAEAIRDGLWPGAIAADIAGDGDTALRPLSIKHTQPYTGRAGGDYG